MENRLTIETAQNVEIEHHVANLGERIAAYLLDGIVQVAYIIVVILIFSIIEPRSDEARWGLGLTLGLPFLFYHFVMEVFFHGQSVGKKALKIKVVKLNGSEVRLTDYFLRWLLRIVDINIFSGAVAIISILATGKGQRLGDILAKTTVVSTRPRTSLHHSHLAPVTENHEITIPEVALLDDEDIATIKEVMQFVQTNQSHHAVQLAYKTKLALEEKMGISSDMKARVFFEIILLDYTYYHTSIEGEW